MLCIAAVVGYASSMHHLLSLVVGHPSFRLIRGLLLAAYPLPAIVGC
jgi:hypothetical protein